MNSINRYSIIQRAFLITWVFLLFACAQTPKQEEVLDPNQRIKQPIPEGAEQAFAQVLSAMDQQYWELAENYLKAMQLNYPELPSVYVNLGWVYQQQGNTAQAIEAYATVLDWRTQYRPDAHLMLAKLHREAGDFALAENVYVQALGVWPDEPKLHINLGILYDLYLDDPARALSFFKQAQAILIETDKEDKQLKGWIRDLERRI